MKKTAVREIVPDVPEGLESGLPNYWYPLLQTEELLEEKAVGLTILGENIVAWRDKEGKPQFIRDRCPHRGAKLSVGRVMDDHIQCLFHGLRFDGAGRCVLIPWEPEESPLLNEVRLPSYPAEELGGYVWAYLGDTERFPPPPLADEIPEELLDEEHFVWFRYPTEIWNANWLLTLDGQDAFHSVVLHAESQHIPPPPGVPVVPLVDRRTKIEETTYGMRAFAIDGAGEVINQGHFMNVKGDRFILPCLSTNPIQPRLNGEAYAIRVWQMAIDEQRTLVARYASFRAESAKERERLQRYFEVVTRPRSLRVSAEDALIAEAQGDLISARSDEYLFTPDTETVKLRHELKKAFLEQCEGRREGITKEALLFPL
jgi:phenylpropionate dioxygenase-like ring-hydroxylating dioxygenase large terminal subunit